MYTAISLLVRWISVQCVYVTAMMSMSALSIHMAHLVPNVDVVTAVVAACRCMW